MIYLVGWTATAENGLADVWMKASDRKAVNAAADRIERALATSPLDLGEGRDRNDRIHFDPPLSVVFRVDAAARVVIVVHCGPSKR